MATKHLLHVPHVEKKQASHIDKLKLLFHNPENFYKTVEKEQGYWNILQYVLIILGLAYLFEILLSMPAYIQFLKGQSLLYNLAENISSLTITVLAVFYLFVQFIMVLVILLAAPFITASIVHLGFLATKIKKDYFPTFKVVAYSMVISVPYGILGSIVSIVFFISFPKSFSYESLKDVSPLLLGGPNLALIIISAIISLASIVHVIWVQVIGLSCYHGITKKKALIGSLLIPAAIIVLVLLILAIIGFKIPQ